MKASPAPLLSTLFTANGGMCSLPSRLARRDPFAPKVMITRRMPPATSFSAHFFASSTFFTGHPVIVSASLSLGTK